MRYLAIDYGTKRTGLAVCDAAEIVASPLAVCATGPALIDEIVCTVASEGIGAVVLGLPLNMDGSEGFQSRQVRRFAKQLAAKLAVPVHFQDERLSSFDAEEKIASSGLSRAKAARLLDAIAAASILEAFLSKKASQ